MSANADTNDMRGDATAADTDDVLAAVPDQREGLSRRTVLKGAAHAAWAVPAVQIATIAPAMAASGAADLSGGVSSLVTAGWNGNNAGASFTASFTITNKNTQPSTGLKVTLTFPTGYALTTSGVSAGWAAAGDGTNVIVFTADTFHQAAGNGSVTFTATFTSTVSNNAGKAVTASISATPGSTGTPGAGTLTVAKKQ